MNIRPAQLSDLDAITDIYNHAILTSTATFDIQPKTNKEQLAWFNAHGKNHPILVAEKNDVVVGWASLSELSDRPAYNISAETAFYIHEQHRGIGIGRKLKAAIIEKARQLGYHTLIARVAADSQASLHLNKSFGFHYVGVMKEVGKKFDKLIDVHILQLILDPTPDSPVRKDH